MRTVIHRILLLIVVLATQSLHAQAPELGEVLRIDTRPGVTVPIYAYWRPGAVASVVLFSGGAGGYGKSEENSWPTSGNFLIRTGKYWAGLPFNVIMVGRPSDGIDLASGNVRTGDEHAADNLAVFKAVKAHSALPLWLVGTSMGTISAAAAAIQDREGLIAGIVLTSSILAYKVPGAVPKQDLEKIRVPTLIVHHEEDACWACRPYEVKHIASGLSQAPIQKTLMIKGGSGVTGGACEAFHHHGYVGVENETIDQIAAWIIKPTP